MQHLPSTSTPETTTGITEYEIQIVFTNYITRLELNEILTEIEYTIESMLLQKMEMDALPPGVVGGSYLQIQSAKSGSIVLLVGAAITGFLGKHYATGFGKGKAAKELSKMGKLGSDFLGDALVPIRKATEALVKKFRARGSNIKDISIKRFGTGNRAATSGVAFPAP